MPFSADELRRWTYALRSPSTVFAAIEALRGYQDRAAIEGLCEQIFVPKSAKTVIACIDALAECDDTLVREALAFALHSEYASVRLGALSALRDQRAGEVDADVERLLHCDPSWLVRREAVAFLGQSSSKHTIAFAANDPHWRVRHALLQALAAMNPQARDVVLGRITELHEANPDVRRAGVLAYLRYRETGQAEHLAVPAFEFPIPALWDWDVAVLQRNLEQLDANGRRAAIGVMPRLLAHADERIRRIAVKALREHGGPRQLADAIRLLDEPRLGADASLAELLQSLNLDRREAAARWILDDESSSIGQRTWATSFLESLTEDAAVPAKHTFSLNNPLVRAASLTVESATALMANPEQERSWHVLAEAARLAKTPIWKIAPARPSVEKNVTQLAPSPLPASWLPGTHPLARRLAPHDTLVCPLGISGHYGLPLEGYARALDAGVNLLFWEPNYHSLTAFFQSITPTQRRAVYLVVGTFEADGARLRRDVERALRMLRVERISLFLIFWVQSWKRIDDNGRATLTALVAEGKIGSYGLSTHNRTLAIEAIEKGWNPIMVRHSAAHRGAEERIFPRAHELGVSVLTFNNTCYARLLRSHRDMPPPSAVDCYRYALSMPGVRACWSAPATLAQLDENLKVLNEPNLTEVARDSLLQFGTALYEEERTFCRLVRAV